MIKTLQNALKQDREGFDLPRSVQDAIPIRRLWPDGIFQFGSKFSKTIRFSDINYAIASKEDKTAMFLGYSELLNALDAGSTTKLTINNKRLNRQDFEQKILLPRQDDYLDGYRAEYNAMLMDKVTDSSNSVVQERYVTLSVHRKSIEEARTFFDRVTADVTTRLNHLDSHSEELDAVERLRVLHDFYRTGEETEFHMDLRDMMRKGHSFKGAICPDSLEFKKDYFIMGDKFGRVLFLKEYASYIKDSMINELTALNRAMMLSIDVIPVPTDEAVREMQSRLLGVETNVTNWQRRQNSNNNFSAVVPYDLEQQRKETREMLDDLTTRDQRMMFAVVTLVHLADTKEELDSDTEALQATARKHLCQMATLNWQQADGLVTALPLGLRRIDVLRTLTTEALAVLMPFKAQEVRDRGGVYYGQNTISKNLIIANRKELLNGNGFVLGVSGSGKSFTAKLELVNVALATNDDIIVIDPEKEYGPIVEGLGGEVIDISATSRNHINAMDMEQGYGDGDNPVVLKSEFLLSLCEQLVGSGKLSAKEKSIIDRCTAQCYHEYIRGGCRGKAPTLQDFHAELLRQPEPEAKDVALAIELFTEGSLNTFAKPTNVDTDARIICYDIRDLGKQLLPVGMLVVLDSVFNRVIRNRVLGRNTWIYIDEIYILFQHEYSANFLFTLWKRVRKYGALCTGATQNVEDLLQSHTARTMLANSEFLVMLNQASTDRAELAALLNISESQLSYITNVAATSALRGAVSAIRAAMAPLAAGGGAVIAVVLVLCLVAALIMSPLGIFFGGEESGGLTMASAVREINQEYSAKLEELKTGSTYDQLSMTGTRAPWPEVLAVYAVKTTSDPANGQEVVTMTDEKKELLKQVFWDMNQLTSFTSTVPGEDDGEDTTTLHITVTAKTADEMADAYGFNASQRQQLAELLSDEYQELWNAVLYGIGTGSGEIVAVTLSQVGNAGGQPYWSWYGFSHRVEWCAIFVSWCANECGYIDAGVIPKFSGCVQGSRWFKDRGLWQDKDYTPNPGDIIFFDWDDPGGFSGPQDGVPDHVGIVEKVENGLVYTVEGNPGDSCREAHYPIEYYQIYGYGTPAY